MLNKKNEVPMTGQVEVFNFSERKAPIRVQVINGEPWFVAKDVAVALQYANPRDAIKKHCKEKGVAFCDSLTDGGVQKLKYINEGNMFRLIVNCNLPMAEMFESWVFDEVLPSIRKTGKYAVSVPCVSRSRTYPRDRNEELGAFYSELQKWVCHKDEIEVAEFFGVSRKHVHEVMCGRRSGFTVLSALVVHATENRKNGVQRVSLWRDRSSDLRELSQYFMNNEEED